MNRMKKGELILKNMRQEDVKWKLKPPVEMKKDPLEEEQHILPHLILNLALSL